MSRLRRIELERDFLAGVAHGVIDLAEAAVADAPLDRIAVERPRAAGEGEAGGAGGRGRVRGGLGHGEVHGFGFHRFQRNHCSIPVQSAVGRSWPLRRSSTRSLRRQWPESAAPTPPSALKPGTPTPLSLASTRL